MHEMGIAIQILNIVNSSLPPEGPVKVTKIHLKLGKLTAIVPSSLSFCMEVVTKDTPAEGAELCFQEVPIVVSCPKCGAETVIEQPPFKCGSCASDRIEIVSGREMVIESIEVAEG